MSTITRTFDRTQNNLERQYGSITIVTNDLSNTFTATATITLKNVSSNMTIGNEFPLGIWLYPGPDGTTPQDAGSYNWWNNNNNGQIIYESTPNNLSPGQSYTISGSKTLSLNKDGTTGGNLYLYIVYGSNDNNPIVIKTSYTQMKINSTWKNVYTWLKVNGTWKRCIL